MSGEAPRLVLSTVGSPEHAERIARALVEERLAACVNLVPGLRSLYWWEGAVQDDREILLLIKTTAERVGALRERLLELHPYEVPEFGVLEIESVSEAYGAWLRESVAR